MYTWQVQSGEINSSDYDCMSHFMLSSPSLATLPECRRVSSSLKLADQHYTHRVWQVKTSVCCAGWPTVYSYWVIEYDKWRQVFESQTVFVTQAGQQYTRRVWQVKTSVWKPNCIMQAGQQYTHRVPRGRQVFESQTVFVVQARKKCQAYLETEWISCGDRWSDFGRSYLMARWSDLHVQLAALDRWRCPYSVQLERFENWHF